MKLAWIGTGVMGSAMLIITKTDRKSKKSL